MKNVKSIAKSGGGPSLVEASTRLRKVASTEREPQNIKRIVRQSNPEPIPVDLSEIVERGTEFRTDDIFYS